MHICELGVQQQGIVLKIRGGLVKGLVEPTPQ